MAHPAAAPGAVPERSSRRAAAARVVASLLVLGGLAIAVSGQQYLPGETAIVEAANAVPVVIGWPFRVVMQLGTLWVAAVVVVVARWFVADTARTTLAGGLAAVVGFRADNVLKDVIDRPRPSAVVEGLDVRETIDGFGFPSGHSTMAFALAAALHPVVPARWRWVLWALAVAVGLARMHVGVHWPADVVGGAALGTAIGSVSWLLATWLVRPTPDRS